MYKKFSYTHDNRKMHNRGTVLITPSRYRESLSHMDKDFYTKVSGSPVVYFIYHINEGITSETCRD